MKKYSFESWEMSLFGTRKQIKLRYNKCKWKETGK